VLIFTFDLLQQQSVSYKNSKISFLTAGNGQKLVICFPGYGEDASSCSFLGKYGGSEFTFIAIDLPFHGKTRWEEGLDFHWEDLKNIVAIILKTHFSENTPGKEKITLLGFSLGGRLALSLYQSIPEQVQKVVLLAPDGLKINFWYWLATQTGIGNRFFKFTMKRPSWFFGFLKLLNHFGFVNASIFKFVNYYIGDQKVRELLYLRWTTLRRLKPDLQKIKTLIRLHGTFFHLVYGKHDRIILPTRGKKFRTGIEKYCTLSVIESGHQVLHEKHAADIVAALRSSSIG